VNKLGS